MSRVYKGEALMVITEQLRSISFIGKFDAIRVVYSENEVILYDNRVNIPRNYNKDGSFLSSSYRLTQLRERSFGPKLANLVDLWELRK
jgi:hypothetical protein